MSRPKKKRRRYSSIVAPIRRATSHDDGTTREPEYPELEGREPLPEEITGRASGTGDDLVTLFGNTDNDHLADGFRGGSEDEDPEEEPPAVN